MLLNGKVAIITGASRGIGKSIAQEFIRQGAKVAFTYRSSEEKARELEAELSANGGEVKGFQSDAAQMVEAEKLVDDVIEAFGTVDIVVNNAGILRDKSFKKMSLDEWDLVINVHLMGSAYVTWHAWPIMYEQNYGRVVFTSSVSGILGSFGQANYGAAKMGMVGLMNNLSREGASHNIHTNCLSPGAATRMTASVPGSSIDADNPDAGNHPGQVSPVILYLSSTDAPNGRIIQAAGGKFASDAVYANTGIDLGVDATAEDFIENADAALDMSDAVVKTKFWRQ